MSNEKTITELPTVSTVPALKEKLKSKSTKKRDQQRQDSHRRTQGEKVMADLQKELDKRLYFGFSTEVKAATNQVIELADQAKVLPVSTRALGFFSQSIFTKLYQTLKNIPLCSVYELYRLTLAQFELKLLGCQRGQIMPYPNDDNLYYRPVLNIEQREVIMGTAVNFGPLANIISAVGQFQHSDNTYYPRLPLPDLLEPAAHIVTFSTLRRVAVALSNRATPPHIRMRFYQGSPLPGALWGPAFAPGQRRRVGQEQHPDFPLLMNPDDFMPEDYDIHDLEQDASRVKNLLGFCARKSVKYVDNSSVLDFSPLSPGCNSLLMSNYYTDGLRNPDVVYSPAGNIDYASMEMTTGPLNEFWSDVKLDPSSAFFGMLQLLGEIPPEGIPSEVYGARLLEHSRQRISHRWSAISGNMLA